MATKGTILVTGGTGYIGSHTTVELIQAGYKVVSLDNLSNSNINVLEGIEAITGIRPTFYEVDCNDEQAIEAVFAKHPDIQGVIHFAASKAVGESVQKPLLYYRNNLLSLIVLLEAMQRHGTKGIVFSSSCTVYGQPEILPVTEDAPIQVALSPYGNTKQINEEILRDAVYAGASYKVIRLRYFNPIGAHESGDIGYHPAKFDGSQKIPLDDSISGGNNGWFWHYYKHSAKMLRPENYERGKFSPAQFLALVRNGENPFIPVPPPKKTQT